MLPGHECSSPTRIGWRGLNNGELLGRAGGSFELFITCDQNIAYQQNLAGRRIAILELSTNDLRRIRAASLRIRAAVGEIQPGEYRRLLL
jgi:hypothetical protein